jgi:hypothetical protein
MSLEAQVERLSTILEQLITKFDHIGAATLPAKEPAAPAADSPAPASPAITPFDFATVRVEFLKLVGKNQPKAVELLAQYGVKKAGELKPEQYAAFHAAVLKEAA